jgi:hypothetical protein
MKYYPTKREVEDAAEENNYLIGHQMLKPFETYPITSITIEKAKKHQGFIVVLSHDVFDGGWAEICTEIEGLL